MFARVTATQGPPERTAEVIRYVQEHIIPAARKERGFKGGYWLGDRKTGKGMALTLWESEEAERASQAMAAQTRAHAVAALGGEIKSVEVYEVVAQAPAKEARPARAKTRRQRPMRAARRKVRRRKKS